MYAVYASTLISSRGNDYSPGDDIVSSSRRIYGLCETIAEAEKFLERLKSAKVMCRTHTYDSPFLRPELTIAEFDPRAFACQQEAFVFHQLDGDDKADAISRFVERLLVEAKKNAADLLSSV